MEEGIETETSLHRCLGPTVQNRGKKGADSCWGRKMSVDLPTLLICDICLDGDTGVETRLQVCQRMRGSAEEKKQNVESFSITQREI